MLDDVLALAALFVLAADPSPPADAAGWTEVSRTSALVVYRRPHAVGSLTEWMATGTIEAAPFVVKNALDDYTPKVGQMPYMAETKVLKRDAEGAVIYNRMAPPLVDDRDYTIRMFDDSYVRNDGAIVYVARWRTANGEGPAPRAGVVRVDKTEGFWRLDPSDDARHTRATYFVVVEPGGNVPQSIADMGTSSIMGDIFTALRARVKVKSYAESKPTAPTKRAP